VPPRELVVKRRTKRKKKTPDPASQDGVNPEDAQGGSGSKKKKKGSGPKNGVTRGSKPGIGGRIKKKGQPLKITETTP